MRVQRMPVVDEYAESGELVVLLPDGRVVALSPLASAVLEETAAGSVAVETLAAWLVDRFGPPPEDASGLVATQEVVESLVQLGLVTAPD
jgi:hypothetical protein